MIPGQGFGVPEQAGPSGEMEQMPEVVPVEPAPEPASEKPKRKRWEQVNKVGYAHVNNDFIFSSNIKHWH